MKAKRPPAPSGKRDAVPDQSIGDASSASRPSNVNEAKSTRGRSVHERVGADRRHRQKSFSIPGQKQRFALADERSRPPGRMEVGSPRVAQTHGFRYQGVEAGGQFRIAPPSHLESG